MPNFITAQSEEAYQDAINKADETKQKWKDKRRHEKRAGAKALQIGDYQAQLKNKKRRFTDKEILQGTGWTRGIFDVTQELVFKALMEHKPVTGKFTNDKQRDIKEAIGYVIEEFTAKTVDNKSWRAEAAADFCHNAWDVLNKKLDPLNPNSDKARNRKSYYNKLDKKEFESKPNLYQATFKVVAPSGESTYVWVRKFCDEDKSGAVPLVTTKYDELVALVEEYKRELDIGGRLKSSLLCFGYQFHPTSQPVVIQNDKDLRRFLINLTVVDEVTRKTNSWEIRLVPKA